MFCIEPPTFAKKIETITATLGDSVKLQGTLKGSPPISVKWMRDSEMLRDDDPNIKMTFENNIAILSITAVAISHGGKYTCQAENEPGQNKYDATLTVQGWITTIETFIENIYIMYKFVTFTHIILL